MLPQLLACILLALWAPGPALAESAENEVELVYLQAGRGQRCFYEFMLPGQEAFGSFAVSSDLEAQVEFSATFADNLAMFRSTQKADNYFFTAKMAGQYAFCISVNPRGPANIDPATIASTVSFKVAVKKPEKASPKDPLARSLEAIGDSYAAIQSEQRQARYREKRMVDDVSSVNRKVWLFFLLELVFVSAAYGFQTAFLTQIHKRV